MAVKGYGRLALFLSETYANSNFKSFNKHIKYLIEQANRVENSIDFTIIGFSGSKYFYHQIYSILSFIMNVGVPIQFIIISDGSYSCDEKKKLEEIKRVQVIEYAQPEFKSYIRFKDLASTHVWGKVFFAYFNLLEVMKTSTIFMEADVLVYNKINAYLHLFNKKNWYLSDTGPHFDSFYEKNMNLPMFSVNNGFAIFNSKPNLNIPYNYMIERFESKTFEYFTPQSAFQMMIENDPDAIFFDPRYFIVSGKDHFSIKSAFKSSDIALRHYVGPVRHKMWQEGWTKVLIGNK